MLVKLQPSAIPMAAGQVCNPSIIELRCSHEIHLTVAGIIPKWKAPKIEMIFNVYSGKNEGKSFLAFKLPLTLCIFKGIATVKATQNGLYGQINFLGVDVLNKTVSRVLVEGEASGFETHDALKELVKLKTTFDDPDIRGHS